MHLRFVYIVFVVLLCGWYWILLCGPELSRGNASLSIIFRFAIASIFPSVSLSTISLMQCDGFVLHGQ
jgi:hypothetical protein